MLFAHAQFLKVEEEAGNPVERMANMLPRIVAADYQPLPQHVSHNSPLFESSGVCFTFERLTAMCLCMCFEIQVQTGLLTRTSVARFLTLLFPALPK